ncbi:MAG: SpoIIE family protein phosphatase, partial [bacterium]
LLEVDSTEPNAFTERHLQLLRRAASILSGSVQLARRLETDAQALSTAEDARSRLSLVAEASRVLASSLDYETTLTSVAQLIVPAVADWCIVDVLNDEGGLAQVVQIHADPERNSLAHELRARYAPSPDASPLHPIYQVVRSGESILHEEVTDADLAARARDPDHLAMLRAMDIRSDMVVPLTLRGRVLGVMSFVRGASGRRFSREDLTLAEEIARRAARAVDTAQLYAAEQRARAEAEEAARRVNVTNSLIALASSALDLGEVFEEFGEALLTLIPFMRLSVSLYAPERDMLTVPYVKGPALTSGRERLEGPKAGTARGWVIDHDHPLIRTDTHVTSEFIEDVVLADAGIHAYLVVPMRVGGRVIGTLNFADEAPGVYGESHARLAQPIADQLALTISRFQLFDQVQRRAGELSETLQRALLPAGLPEPPFSALGVLYLPADPQAGIGGDWYDAVFLPDDTILLSMGDVAGHGVAAAAAMGQVRHIVRAYALEGRRPGEIVNHLNRYLCRLPDNPQLSICIATLDLYSGAFTYCGGGHPPVLVLRPKQPVAGIACTGPPIGLLMTLAYPEGRTILEPGTRLIAYTDGLIEATRDIVASERALAEAAIRTRVEPPARAATSLVQHVLGGSLHEDDVAVMVFDLLPADAPLSFGVPASPDSLYRVRRAVRAFATHAGAPAERIEEIVFAVGEAALNTVEHAYRDGGGQLQIRGERRNGAVVITVRDVGQWREPVDRGRGRGLKIMREFADEVEVDTGPEGTVVTLAWQVAAKLR